MAHDEAHQTLSGAKATGDPVSTANSPEVPASSRWDRATKRTVLVMLFVAGAIILWFSQPVLPIVIFAGIIAYLLSPIVDTFERIHIPRSVSTVVLFVLLFIGFILLPVLLIPVLLDQLNNLADFNVQTTAAGVLHWLNESIGTLQNIQILGYEIPIGDSLREFQANFQQYLVMPTLSELLSYIQQVIGTTTSVISSTAVIGISVVGGIVQFFFTLLVTFFMSLYLTKDAPAIRRYVQSLLPPSYQPEFGELLRQISHIWQAFFRGQIVLCLVIGVTTWLALEVAGMPGALILGILAGVLEIVPNLGPTMAMIPAVIVALIQGSDVLGPLGIDNVSFALITIGIYFIIQQLENNIVVPRVIGDSVNLHPVVVICGVVIGFNVGNLLGAFLAAPVIASLRIIGSYVHAKLLDYPPFEGRKLPSNQPRRRLTYRRIVKGKDLAKQRRPRRNARGATPGRQAPAHSGKEEQEPVENTVASSSVVPST